MKRRLEIEVNDELLAFLDQLAADQSNPLRRQPTDIEQAVLDALRRHLDEEDI
jgi:predicted transcriptional regulator